MLRPSSINIFSAWQFYRTILVPVLLLAALLSILYRGAFISMPEGPEALRSAIVAGLGGASLLMLMHAFYLLLMAYHLVYRFPVERIQSIGLALAPISGAYVLYAVYDYGNGGPLAWASAGAFVLAYLAMVFHGTIEARAEHAGQHAAAAAPRLAGLPRQSVPAHSRPIQQLRQNWMLGTDGVMLLLAFLTFLAAADRLPFDMPAPWTGLTLPEGGVRGVPAAFLQKASAKDGLIIAALLLYALRRRWARVEIQKHQSDGHAAIQALQKLESIERLDPDGSRTPMRGDEIREDLPLRARWLDVGSLKGILVNELLERVYADGHADGPAATHFVDLPEVGTDEAAREIRAAGVVHVGHAAYTPAIARGVTGLLKHAQPGTLLLLRYTADASFYRAISASTACAPFRPYIFSAIHPLLLRDLERDGWDLRWRALLKRHCEIDTPVKRSTAIDWCDAQYGEFSGDVVERYLNGFAACGEKRVRNDDYLVLLRKQAARRPYRGRAAPPNG